jgi:hypothetical protein
LVTKHFQRHFFKLLLGRNREDIGWGNQEKFFVKISNMPIKKALTFAKAFKYVLVRITSPSICW